jgi:hypothetical protein
LLDNSDIGCLFGSGGGWSARAAVRGQLSLRHSIAGGLDCRCASGKTSCIRSLPVMAGPGFSFMREIIFGQLPPKQPLDQNRNGSRFGCLASY